MWKSISFSTFVLIDMSKARLEIDRYFSTGGGGEGEGVPTLVSQHTTFLAIQQFQTIFSLFLFV